MLQRNRETLSPAGALIANSFLLGEEESPDAELSKSISEAFRDSGTIHLLVVSGTQVSLVMGLFLWLGWRVWPWRFLFWGLGAGAVGGFWLLTDGSASVSRAALMGAVVVLGLALNREPDGENCLGIAALALLAGSRFAVFDIGAQLSFGAVWGLLRLTPPLYRAFGPAEGAGLSGLRPLHAGLAALAAASLAAHLATAPILAFHFQRVSWSGLLANLPMTALAGLFTYAALAHSALPVWGFPVEYGASSFTGWAGFFSQPPFGAREVFPFPVWLLPVYYAALALPGLAPRSRLAPGALALGLGAALFLCERMPTAPPPRATLRAIDVGQGDAMLLQSPGGAHILVDAGKAEVTRSAPSLVRALRGLRVPSLDAVVVSHADSDHTGGLPRLLEHVPVRLLVQNVDPDPEEAELWERVLRTAARHRIPTHAPVAGDRLRIRDSTLLFLGPLRATRGNEASLVFRWDAAGTRFLLTGDAGHPSEREMLDWGAELRSDVLKVGHHGSDGSTGAEWLRAVQPRLAVLSCGRDNRFGHPAPRLLERLEAVAVPIARTDHSGMVTVEVDRGGVHVRPWLPP